MSRKVAPKREPSRSTRPSKHGARAAGKASVHKASAAGAKSARSATAKEQQKTGAKAESARGPGRPSQGAGAEQSYPSTARVIKRYGNRRLYDAQLSRCVTMTEIADMVRERQDVRVVDGESGEDLTKRMLVQIILEQQNASNLELLPVELLHQIISVRSQPVAGWLEQYLQAGAEFLDRQTKAAAASTRAPHESLGTLFPWLNPDSWKGTGVDPRAATAGVPPTAHHSPESPRDTPPRESVRENEPVLRQELADLQRRFAELNARLGRA